MKDPTPIAVASRSFSRHSVLRAELLDRYSDVRFNDSGVALEREALIDFLRGRVKAITALERLDEHVFATLPELRVIGKYGVGLDMIDLEAMERYGVRLGWQPGVNCRSVAELVVAAAINLLHLAPTACAELRGGMWRQLTGRQLTGRTVGIVGCGHVGREVVLLLRPFGCRLLAHDIVDYSDFYKKHSVEAVSLEELLRISDVITLHLPLDSSTRHILNAERLRLIQKGSVLINMARGGVVDDEAVKRMLQGGLLAGAAFDVFDQEPPRDRELLNLSNVMVTPHIGGSTEEAILAMGRAAIQGLESAVLPSRIAELRQTELGRSS